MDRWRDAPEIRLTLILLTGSLPLVAAGSGGVTASPVLVAGLLVAAGGLAALGVVSTRTDWRRVDSHEFLADLWLGPTLAAVVVLFFLDASAGEVQALGGLVGLAGMANYFLRPVYHLCYGLGRRLASN